MSRSPAILVLIFALLMAGCTTLEKYGSSEPESSVAPSFSTHASSSPSASLRSSGPFGRFFSLETRPDGAFRVSEGPGSDQNAAFLNDDLLVFTRFSEGYNAGPAALMGMYLANGTVFQILKDEAQNVNVNGNPFSPDRRKLCYSSDVEDTDEIWCIDLATMLRQRITRHTSSFQFIEPSVSSYGETVAFEVHLNSEEPDDADVNPGQIWQAGFDGNERPLVTDGDNRLPMFNPSDDRILFQRRIGNPEDSFFRLFIREKNGTLSELDIPTSGGTDASWANADQVVYSAEGTGLAFPKIFSFDLKSQKGRQETFDPTVEDGAPAVSPNGDWLAFEAHLTEDETSPSRIWLVRR